MYPSGHARQKISSKHAINVYYIIVDSQPTIHKAYANSEKLIQHGYSLFVMWKTQMMITGTAMPIPEEIFSASCLWHPLETKIKL